MRFWIGGPRIFGLRTGVSFGPPRARQSYAPAVDFVYVVSGASGFVKIGITTDPAARLATLQTGSPDRLALVFTAPAYGNSHTIEQEAHAILGAHRAAGEWFAVSPDMAIAAIFAAADRTGCSLADRPAGQSPRDFMRGYWKWGTIIGIALIAWDTFSRK